MTEQRPQVIEDAEFLPAVSQANALVLPVAEPNDLVDAMRKYQATKEAILHPSDYQDAGQGRSFVKRSGWAKLAIAFGISSEILPGFPKREYDDDGKLVGAECQVRAIAPNGRHADGWGYCSVDEPRFSRPAARQKLQHDLAATSECVPLQAQILTRWGWKHHTQIFPGEMVLGYDPEADVCVWTRLLDVNVFENQPVVRMHNQSFDATCTPNHTWAVQRRVGVAAQKRHKLVMACDLGRNGGLILAARAEGGDLELAPEDAAILGWILTDGAIRRSQWPNGTARVQIDQSKQPYVEEIGQLVGAHASVASKAGSRHTFPTGRAYETRDSYRFSLRAPLVQRLLGAHHIASKADIPGLIPFMSQDARAAMLDTMLKGDGTRNGAGWVFGAGHPAKIEAFQLLATLEGRGLGQQRTRIMGANPVVEQTLRAHRIAEIASLQIEDAGIADVWCPTTELGTWVMRLGGQIAITGNTRARNRAYSNLFGHGEVSAEEIDGDSAPAGNHGTAKHDGNARTAGAAKTPTREEEQTNKLRSLVATLARLTCVEPAEVVSQVQQHAGVDLAMNMTPVLRATAMDWLEEQITKREIAEQSASTNGTEFPKASPNKPASANQLATIAKLSRLIEAPEDPNEDMTSAEAADRITELSRLYNESHPPTKRSA